MSRWRWILKRAARRLWLRASLIGALGVGAAILAAVADRYIPWTIPASLSRRIGADAVDGVLNVIASSMLAVTTFSLSVMTTAYGAAASSVTPRATKLLIEDQVTQNVLSTFVGSFLFSIVGLVVLQTGAYGDRGRVILFFVTIGVIGLIVVSLLRWIDYLTRFGRVGETTRRVEEAALAAIRDRIEHPFLGGTPASGPAPAAAAPVFGETIGYVQHIDMTALSDCCAAFDAEVYVEALPGAFVHSGAPLARVAGTRDEDALKRALGEVAAAFAVGDERSFDQDPRFGLIVLSEIAQRALSPAVNDPGTAIDVIGRAVRLLSLWADGERPAPEAAPCARVHVPALALDDLFDDAFMAIGRDGAAMIEVQSRLLKSLFALARQGDPRTRAAALRQARLAHARAEAALTLPQDRRRLNEIVQDAAP
ncbi:DUF2254 domain-containing protein [Methylocella sp.]|uniref:DUF2254 domain-containing protein n=1 Tax=Methylocella sp. TaxID=1978226 RepID=UPI003783E724